MRCAGDLGIDPSIPTLSLEEIYSKIDTVHRSAFESTIRWVDIRSGTTLLAPIDHPDRIYLLRMPAGRADIVETRVVGLIEMLADTCFGHTFCLKSGRSIETVSRDDLFALLLDRPAIASAISHVLSEHLRRAFGKPKPR